MQVTIQGLQDAQRDNLKMIRALTPFSGFGDAIRVVATEVQRYAIMITHVDTGALRASHRIQWNGGLEAEVSLAESAVNPRTGERTSEYGVYEHERAGTHAFYERTYEERGERALEIGAVTLMRSFG